MVCWVWSEWSGLLVANEKEMKRYVFLCLLIVLLVSCSKKESAIRLIYSGCCWDQYMSVSISNKGLMIFENSEKLMKEQAAVSSYKLIRVLKSADTLMQLDSNIISVEYAKMKNEIKANSIYADSIGNLQFDYEEAPAELVAKYKLDKKVVRFSHYKNYQIFITENYELNTRNESERNKLFILQINSHQIDSVIIKPYSAPSPEFLLADLTGDSKPEVIVFYYYHLMNHDLTSFSVYKIFE